MKKHRVVLDIGIEGADKWEAVFRNIDNLRADLGANSVEIEGVIHGKAWPLLVRPEKGGAPEFHPKVEAAIRAGVKVPYACKGGMCCTCRARIVEGRAEMAVNYSLEPWEIERGFILTCQALPRTERLVVDYDAM